MNISPSITRKILTQAPNYSKSSVMPSFLHEKLEIITHSSQNTALNKKSEILSNCCHENKYLLSHNISPSPESIISITPPSLKSPHISTNDPTTHLMHPKYHSTLDLYIHLLPSSPPVYIVFHNY